LKRNIKPTANRAVASVLARWFSDIILAKRIVPDLKDNYVFSVRYTDLLENTVNGITQQLRKALKDYGYKLRKSGNLVLVTKFR